MEMFLAMDSHLLYIAKHTNALRKKYFSKECHILGGNGKEPPEILRVQCVPHRTKDKRVGEGKKEPKIKHNQQLDGKQPSEADRGFEKRNSQGDLSWLEPQRKVEELENGLWKQLPRTASPVPIYPKSLFPMPSFKSRFPNSTRGYAPRYEEHRQLPASLHLLSF